MIFLQRFGSQWKAGKYGYALGGTTGSYVATADRIAFSTRATAAQTSANLSTSRNYGAGVTDTCRYAYCVAGRVTTPSAGPVATTDCVTLSNSTTAALSSADLPTAKFGAVGISTTGRFAFVLGGNNGSAQTATIHAMDYAARTLALLGSTALSAARGDGSHLSDGVRYGYVLGGQSPVVVTGDRLDIAAQTSAALSSSNLSVARNASASFGSERYGYAVGGTTGSDVDTTDRIDYRTGVTAAHTPGNLAVARRYQYGMSDGRQYGYALGGVAGSVSALASSLPFATQTMELCASADLSQARYGHCTVADYNV